jgi:predicted O-methyltransferase YrrM
MLDKEWIAQRLATATAAVPAHRYRALVAAEIMRRDPTALLHGIGPLLNRDPRLADVPLDLDPSSGLEFEDLAGFFASTSLNHGLIGMPIRQAAYIFGVARRSGAKTAVEIGRWRGGSTIVLAAAMGPGGKVWSIDLGEKEARLFVGAGTSFDEETRAFCDRFGLDVELLVGDSRTIEVDTGEVDVVLIDGDHTYEGCRNDFDRFGRRVRVGGAVLFDDAFTEQTFPTTDTVNRVIEEILAEPGFRLVKQVDRLAHLERVA